jgi:hypothetical protein
MTEPNQTLDFLKQIEPYTSVGTISLLTWLMGKINKLEKFFDTVVSSARLGKATVVIAPDGKPAMRIVIVGPSHKYKNNLTNDTEEWIEEPTDKVFDLDI